MAKEKMNTSVTVRMTKTEKFYFQIAAYFAGTTPSKFLRMTIDASINAVKLGIQKGEIDVEDFKTMFDYKL